MTCASTWRACARTSSTSSGCACSAWRASCRRRTTTAGCVRVCWSTCRRWRVRSSPCASAQVVRRRATVAGLDGERLRRLRTEHDRGRARRRARLARGGRARGEARCRRRAAGLRDAARARLDRTGSGRDVALRSLVAPRLSLSSWTPYSTLLGTEQDDLLAELFDLVDQVVVYPEWSERRKRRFAEVASRAAHAVELAILLAPRGARVLAANPAATPKTRPNRWRRSFRTRRRSASTRSTSTTTGCSGRTTSAIHGRAALVLASPATSAELNMTSTSVTTLTSGSPTR